MQGIAKVKKAPARIAAVRKATEAVGGKMTAWYLTFGRYDFVVIAEFPDAKAAARLLLVERVPGQRQHRDFVAFTEVLIQGRRRRVSLITAGKAATYRPASLRAPERSEAE